MIHFVFHTKLTLNYCIQYIININNTLCPFATHHIMYKDTFLEMINEPTNNKLTFLLRDEMCVIMTRELNSCVRTIYTIMQSSHIYNCE